jgi:hypothetical protein
MRGTSSEPVLHAAASLPSEDGLPSVPSAGLALDRARSVSPPSGSELDDAQLLAEDYGAWRVRPRRAGAPAARARRRRCAPRSAAGRDAPPPQPRARARPRARPQTRPPHPAHAPARRATRAS